MTGGEGARGLLVLVAEDEPAIADLLELYLGREGYVVVRAPDGPTALAAAEARSPAAIVLDIGLPGLDGMEVCRRLRAAGNWTPVLFVTARDDEVDRIVGLELGADDYITKPFSPREVVSRVKAVLRRAEGATPAGQVLTSGDVTLDPVSRTVVAAGRDVALTATEFDLLAHLMRHRRQVLRREQLLAEVWGYPEDVSTRTVDVHIAALRAKLGVASPVRTVRGVGYAVD
ncbi:response regulator transcription factor [Sporichthya sp.]|uniref:response regulator transcription factor n=1 Tax=Sporichthya sp. TaxID=65475 RepID=UPI0017C8A492|nr:response regulator transcription factor [Sporichthya sp.]MBA3745801.1 response regulator transcription factor [Sporichthya sp.]